MDSQPCGIPACRGQPACRTGPRTLILCINVLGHFWPLLWKATGDFFREFTAKRKKVTSAVLQTDTDGRWTGEAWRGLSEASRSADAVERRREILARWRRCRKATKTKPKKTVGKRPPPTFHFLPYSVAGPAVAPSPPALPWPAGRGPSTFVSCAHFFFSSNPTVK